MSHYRDAAFPDELADLEALDKAIAVATAARRAAVDKRNRLVNRLVKRTKLRERYSPRSVSRETKADDVHVTCVK